MRTTCLFLCFAQLPICLAAGVFTRHDALQGDEVKQLEHALDNIAETYFPSFRFSIGSGPSREDFPFLAIDRLSEIGTRAALQVLEGFLTRPGRHRLHRELKQYAMLNVGRLGNKPALDVLWSFEQWAEQRREDSPPFRFGTKDHASDHYSAFDLKPLASVMDKYGVEWAVFEWGVFPGTNRRDWELWLIHSQDAETWTRPVFLNIPFHRYADDKRCTLRVVGEGFILDCQGASHRFTLDEKSRDTDKDGLTDLVEQRVFTDPRNADTDGDGVPDGLDGNPLTPPLGRTNDVTEIRQAVFSFMFATSNSDEVLVMVEGEDFAQQEYRGYRGIVIPAPRLGNHCTKITRFDVSIDPHNVAKVNIDESGQSSAGWRIGLKKVQGKWVIVEYRLIEER